MSERITILYIDDEPINVMLFATIFKKNYHVITGTSGSEGLEKLAGHPEIKAVFSDMKMPGMDGIEFAEQVRIRFPKVSCFIITGYDITGKIADALEKKTILKHFKKPFNVADISQAIEEVAV